MYAFWFKKERGMYMRRSIKKAVAFALATATVVTSLGVTQPVKAAEYDNIREVLPKEYEWYTDFGDSALFVNEVNVAKENEDFNSYVDEIVLVDKNGEKSTVDVKTTDGKYKYKYASYVSNKYLAMVREDGKYDLYMSDGTWFGNKEVTFDELFPIANSNFAMKVGNTVHIVDKNGKILAKDVFEMDGEGYIWLENILEDYIYVGATNWSDTENKQARVFDKNYKEVTSVDFNGLNMKVLTDELIVVYNKSEAVFYGPKLKKNDFSYKVVVPENPSASAEKILVSSSIEHIWVAYDYATQKEVLAMSVRDTYKDAIGNEEQVDNWLYYNLSTLERIESIVLFGEETSEISNTDLTVTRDEGKFELLLGDKKVADNNSVVDFMLKNIKGLEQTYALDFIGVAGDLYIQVYTLNSESVAKYYTLLVEKESGYDFSKAKIIDKEMYGYASMCGGYIKFDDSTSIINGKEYGKDVEIDFIYGSRDKYYIATEDKNQKKSSTLYDKNHNKVLVRTDIITDMVADVNVVVYEEVEAEGYSYPIRQYGCVSFTKTLDSSEEVLEEVLEKLENIEEGEKVEVEIKKDVPIKAEIFETIKGKEVEVEVKLDNGMSWNINGKNVESDKLTDVNLTVDVVKDVIPTAAIEKIELKGEKIELSLAHTGDFGFTAELKMNVKPENAGKFANRFFYNPDTKQLEFQEAVKIDEKGDVIFTYTHASDYVIILSDTAYEVPANTPKPDGTVKPGDMANVGMLVVLLGAGAVMLMSQKKKSFV